MIANLHINNQIGDFNGKKGINLVDLVAQLEGIKSAATSPIERILVHINSPGGVVETGEQIASWIEDLKKNYPSVDTISAGRVASIATIPFLAGTRRIIRNGDTIMIHNPWAKPEGDATMLRYYADDLEKTERKMAKIYADKTGVSEDAIKSFMANETVFDSQKALELNFATEMEKQLEETFAYLKPEVEEQPLINNNPKIMKKFEKLITFFNSILEEEEGPETVMLDAMTSEGQKLQIEAESWEAALGAAVLIVSEEGTNPAPEGDYILDDGRTVTVDADGMISSITEPTQEDEESDVAKLQAEIDELKASLQKSQEETSKAVEELSKIKTPELKENVKALALAMDEIEKEKEELRAFKTHFEIPEDQTFAKYKEENDENFSEKMAERKKNYKQTHRLKTIS